MPQVERKLITPFTGLQSVRDLVPIETMPAIKGFKAEPDRSGCGCRAEPAGGAEPSTLASLRAR